MAKVVPTILATNPQDYATRLDRISTFSKRVHVDISDGVFTPTTTIGLAQVHADGLELDLHLMVEDPQASFENIVSLHPSLVIIHFESNGDLGELIDRIKELGIKVGLAIKKGTVMGEVKDLLSKLDHLLVFTGNLGFNGGEFDAECLDKIAPARALNGDMEIGVDGGIDNEAARQSVEAGADVLNSGSFIHNSSDPEAAFMQLEAIANGEVT
jgi:ribulose-phosphate 3-epimerase